MAGALGIVYVVWGSTYLAIRVMVETVPPLLGAGARFLIAGAALWAWVRLRRAGPRLTGREIAACAVVGVLLTFGGNGLVTVAERDVPSGLAALLIASEPLIVVVLRAVWRERVSTTTLIGVMIGFAGVALLLAPGQRPEGASFGASLLVVGAAISWAGGSFAGSKLAMPRDPVRSTAAQMLIGGAAMLAVAGLAGEFGAVEPREISGDSWLAFSYLVVAGSIVAFTAYAWLLRNVPIGTVSTYAYVNPVIAVALGWAILDESVTAATLVGAAIVVGSVALTVRHEGVGVQAEPAPPAPPAPASVERQ